MKRVFVCAATLLGFGLLIGGNHAQDAKPKYTISEVMKKAMGPSGKGGGYKKMEKAEQVEFFTALAQNKPPRGEGEAWKAKTDALVAAAKGGDAEKLAKAANCMACHSEHKGKK
jgi:hypothetical protein